MTGIYVTRGMALSIPAGGLSLSIGDDGKVKSSLTLHVRFDVCPTWIELALQHLATAKAARIKRQAAWAGTDEDEKAAALEREFEASMQAIMAAAIALDAFYAIIQSHVPVPQSLVDRWRNGRTPRASQITEILRQAFRLKPEGTKILRSNLKQIFRMRDLAVHPSGKIEAPIYHPELDVGVEWRFAYFRAENAETVVNGAIWIFWDLCHHDGKSADPKILEYTGTLKQRLISLLPNGRPSAEITTRDRCTTPPRDTAPRSM